MRINEVVTEGFVDNVKQGFEKGSASMDRLLSPSKWFKKSDNTQSAPGTAAPVATPAAAPKVDTLSARNTLASLASGRKLYTDDIQTIKLVYAQVKAGNITPKQGTSSTLKALDNVLKGKSLDDKQKEIINSLKSFY